MAKTIDKPIRLYVMTIFIALAYGLLPLVSVFPFTGGFLLVGPMFLPLNGSVQVLYDANGEIPLLLLVITLCLSLSAVGAVVVTFFGIREARWPTIVLLTLDVAWWFFLVISAIMGSENAPESFRLVFELLIPPIWLAF